ncbi:hypothetical protein Pan97_41920 [Bremerella volcania]|uniref:NfeD-like C-terminal domain-containing protein n=1 Tax=Bremerella volcania TaxID=2527984 RepID=A0A518CD33_9BACT|nr:NfeD family protein [Bremerella volcania]QDU77130.1 hypothetical protein Pan97_41920 [Bremerella volcania]
MDQPIHPGTIGKTVGALRPAGHVEIHGHTHNARSEMDWIDDGQEVVVTRRSSNSLIVRTRQDGEEVSIDDRIDLTQPIAAEDDVDLTAPPSVVEKVNPLYWSMGLACVVGSIAMWMGTPIDFGIILVPICGVLSGVIYRWTIGSAAESTAPREDHRTLARALAYAMIGMTIAGAFFGVAIFGNFAALSIGLVAGTFFGAAMCWLLILFTHAF